MGRHGSRTALIAVLCAIVMALAAQSALAVPEVGDAGDLPLTAQEPGPAGSLSSIEGEVAGSSDRDMYKICLTGAGDFSATTVGGAGFDTQLFLFDEQGMGVYANDDKPLTHTLQSELPAGHTSGPTRPGVYYLAISAFDWDPQSAPAREGFIFGSSSGVLGPTRGGGAAPITGWAFRQEPVEDGVYTIFLTGTRSCVDTTPPTIELTTPGEGAEYARDEVVAAKYTCADELDGSGLASCEGTVPPGEGIDTATLGTKTFTVTATDRRGNLTTVTHTYSVVDETPPRIELQSPGDGAEYGRGDVVTAQYACLDEEGGSGVESCEGTVAPGAEIDTATLGRKTFTVTAQDEAGNRVSVTHTYAVVDRTPPRIELETPADGAEYERGQVVPAQYACADDEGGSEIASCSGPVPPGTPIDTGTVGEQSFTVRAEDDGGNVVAVTHHYTVVDTTAPTIRLSSPRDGATYSVGEPVLADYECVDEPGAAPAALCEGSVLDGAPIDSATPGDHSFTVRAQDAAGNSATQTATYRVEERFRFDFEGFFWPVVNRPRVNVVKAGRIVPIRFSLDGFEGHHVIAHGYPRSREIHCGSHVDARGGEPTRSAGRYGLRYKPHRDLYVYLWQTDRHWAGDCRQFILKLADGSYHRVDFRFVGRRHFWHDDRDH